MNTPYNTGKIKIGKDYQPPRRPHTLNKDELLLQEALLSKPRRLNTGLILYIGILAVVGISFAVVA